MLAHVDFKLGLMHWLSRRPSGHFSHNHSGDIDIFETPIGHSTFYKVLQIFLLLVIPFLDAPFKIHVFPTTGFVSFARSEWECWFIIMLYPFFVFFQDFISFLAVIFYFPSRPKQASEHLTMWASNHLSIWACEHLSMGNSDSLLQDIFFHWETEKYRGDIEIEWRRDITISNSSYKAGQNNPVFFWGGMRVP